MPKINMSLSKAFVKVPLLLWKSVFRMPQNNMCLGKAFVNLFISKALERWAGQGGRQAGCRPQTGITFKAGHHVFVPEPYLLDQARTLSLFKITAPPAASGTSGTNSSSVLTLSKACGVDLDGREWECSDKKNAQARMHKIMALTRWWKGQGAGDNLFLMMYFRNRQSVGRLLLSAFYRRAERIIDYMLEY
jgi:hypothetical protein